MRTKLIACFAGVCMIGAIYVTYRLYDLSNIIPQLTQRTAALAERITRSEADNQRNSEEIATIGKFVRAQKEDRDAPYISFPKFDGNSTEVYKSGKKPSRIKTKKNKQENEYIPNQPETRVTNTLMSGNNHPAIAKAVSGDPEGDANASFHTELNNRMTQLKHYAADNGLEKDFAFIADVGVNSGKKRFYLVDLVKMEIVKSGLMAYTRKGEGNATKVYRIEKTGMDFYELYSLDKTGNVISPEPEILSPVSCVPNAEAGSLSCESDGGPGVSPKFFDEIQQLIKTRKKPMLLWMFR